VVREKNEFQKELLCLQLADSAFPVGSFAHSSGIEAAFQWKELQSAEDLRVFLVTVLRQTTRGTLPLLVAAHRQDVPLSDVDELANATLSNHVANRASRAQGQALLATAIKVFRLAELTPLQEQVHQGQLAAHLAPLFGVVCRALELPAQRAVELFLFIMLRDMISAAVRLNIVGPLAGQRLQYELAEHLEQLSSGRTEQPWQEITQTAPLVELLQANHDRLYSRLFQS
jgi:urease accessory protein